jgi:methionine-rich copper-binding protein CopC
MTRHRARLRAASIAVALLATLGLPATVLGHAELDTISPADRATVAGSPAAIVLTFSQDLDPAKSSIRVVDAAGAVVVQGGTVPAGKPRELDLAITTPLPPGAYEIRWTSFSSEDGEQDRGVTSFTVTAAPSPSPTPAPTATPASVVPSVAPSPTAPSVAPAPSAPPATPATSTSDALIPIVVVLLVLAGLGAWLLRGRSRARG